MNEKGIIKNLAKSKYKKSLSKHEEGIISSGESRDDLSSYLLNLERRNPNSVISQNLDISMHVKGNVLDNDVKTSERLKMALEQIEKHHTQIRNALKQKQTNSR